MTARRVRLGDRERERGHYHHTDALSVGDEWLKPQTWWMLNSYQARHFYDVPVTVS